MMLLIAGVSWVYPSVSSAFNRVRMSPECNNQNNLTPVLFFTPQSALSPSLRLKQCYIKNPYLNENYRGDPGCVFHHVTL